MPIKPEDIVLEDGPSKGRYLYRTGAGTAEVSFTRSGASTLIIDHTAVPDALRGEGVGQALVARAVADARAAGKIVLPLCPFAAAQFRRHPDWADLLPEHMRTKA